MDARCIVHTAVDPPELIAQGGEDALHLASEHRLAEQAAPRPDEERRVVVA